MQSTDEKRRGESAPDSPLETQETAIGNHVVRVEPDIVVLRLRGDYELHEQQRITAIFSQAFAERGSLYLLGDISEVGRMSIEARRASAEAVSRSRIAAVAVIGASPHLRLVVNLGQRATILLGARPYPLQFMKSEEEARVWLRAER